MIGEEFTKENALPYDLWGLLSYSWKPAQRMVSQSFCKGSRNAVRIIGGSVFT